MNTQKGVKTQAGKPQPHYQQLCHTLEKQHNYIPFCMLDCLLFNGTAALFRLLVPRN